MAVLLSTPGRAAEPAWTALTAENGLPGDEIQFLREGDDGTIYIGTLTGLGLWRNGQCTVLLAEPEVWDVLPAGPDRWWIGTGHGVFLTGGKEKSEPALKDYSIAPLIQVAEGKVWAVAKSAKSQEGFVAQFDGTTWAPVKAFAGERVKDLFRSRDGRLWLAVEGNGILEVPAWNATDQAVRHLESRDVTAFEEDDRGRIWCGTWGSGLHVLVKGQWTRLLEKEKSAILDVDVDRQGRVWVATNAHGLWRQEGEKWVNDLPAERGINLMEPTADGRIWISNQAHGGLRYWDGKTWHEALPGPLPMRCLLEAKDGTLWVGGVLDGLHVLKK